MTKNHVFLRAQKSSKHRLPKIQILEAVLRIFWIWGMNSERFWDHFGGREGVFFDVFPRFHFWSIFPTKNRKKTEKWKA